MDLGGIHRFHHYTENNGSTNITQTNAESRLDTIDKKHE